MPTNERIQGAIDELNKLMSEGVGIECPGCGRNIPMSANPCPRCACEIGFIAVEKNPENTEQKMANIKKERGLFKCPFCNFKTGALRGIDKHAVEKHGVDP